MPRGLRRLRHLDPREIDAAFSPKMRQRERRLVPEIIEWLEELEPLRAAALGK